MSDVVVIGGIEMRTSGHIETSNPSPTAGGRPAILGAFPMARLSALRLPKQTRRQSLSRAAVFDGQFPGFVAPDPPLALQMLLRGLIQLRFESLLPKSNVHQFVDLEGGDRSAGIQFPEALIRVAVSVGIDLVEVDSVGL
jgi:hypothetical protein